MDQATQNFVVALLGIIVGAVLGGGGVLVIIRGIVVKVKGDQITLDYLERLYNSIPVEGLRDLLRDVAVVADKVTDGKPNVPEVPTATTGIMTRSFGSG